MTNMPFLAFWQGLIANGTGVLLIGQEMDL
jgi:hypothetical protein